MFSIIVPVYNVEKYLVECLESLKNQTSKNYEVILINDGSTDNSKEICEKYAINNKNFTMYSKKNGGLSDARNYGIKRAKGEYVLFVDSDDYVDKYTIENYTKLVTSMEKKIDIIIGNAWVLSCNTKKLYNETLENNQYLITGKKYYISSLKKGNLHVPTWLHIFNREFLLKNNLFFKKGIFHEDEEHTVRAYLKADTIFKTNVTHYFYRIRSGSIMKNSKNIETRIKDLKSIFNDLEHRIKLLNDKDLLREYENYWVSVFLHYAFEEKISLGTNKEINRRIIWTLKTRGKTKIKKLLFLISPNLYFYLLKKRRLNLL